MRYTLLPTDADGFPIDTEAILWTQAWLDVLAKPHEYRALQRPVDAAVKAVLLCLLDVWIAYVDRGDWYLYGDPPEEDRPALARKLRALLEAWTPPDLPAEITEAARALLDAEGEKKRRREEGGTWDDVRVVDPTETIDSYLLWPEGLAAVWPKKGATAEEKAARAAERRVQIRKYMAEVGLNDVAKCVIPAQNLAWLLACQRIMRKVNEMPSREHVLEHWDGLQSLVDWEAGRTPEGDRQLSEIGPPVNRLRALCESWTPSADVPSEIQRAARDLLAAFGMPEPAEGWDRFEGEAEAGDDIPPGMTSEEVAPRPAKA
jgi:hypothetical protein